MIRMEQEIVWNLLKAECGCCLQYNGFTGIFNFGFSVLYAARLRPSLPLFKQFAF